MTFTDGWKLDDLAIYTDWTLHAEFSRASFVAKVLLVVTVDSVFILSICLVYHVEPFYEFDIYIWNPLVPGEVFFDLSIWRSTTDVTD